MAGLRSPPLPISRTMKLADRILFLALIGILSLPVSSAETTQQAPAAVQSAPAEHSLERESAAIRKHHLKRLDDRLTIPAHQLHESCRYESEVSTHPPAKRVALSFDDGPEPGQTEYILETLKKHGISAGFFLVGSKVQKHPELVAMIAASGHNVIGNHSWDHPNFHEIDAREQAGEVNKTEEVLAKQLKPKLFRYPYGNSSCETNELLHSRDYQIVGWHVDSCDWAFDRNGSVDAKEALSCGVLPQNTRDFVEHVLSSVRAHNGGIVLMHEIHPHTLRHLDEIITRLEKDGFSFISLTDPSLSTSLR